MASHLNIYVDNEYLTLYIQYVVNLRTQSTDKNRTWSLLAVDDQPKYLSPDELLAKISKKLRGDPDEIEEGYLPLVNKLIIELDQTVNDGKQDEQEEEIWFKTRGIAAELRNTLQSNYPKKDRNFYIAILELGKQLELLAPWIKLSSTPLIIKGIGEWLLN